MNQIELYQSPKKESNEERLGLHEDSCICCGKRTNMKFWIHLTTDMTVIDCSDDDPSFIESELQSQGCFPVGPECKKHFPKNFITTVAP